MIAASGEIYACVNLLKQSGQDSTVYITKTLRDDANAGDFQTDPSMPQHSRSGVTKCLKPNKNIACWRKYIGKLQFTSTFSLTAH